MASSIIFRLVVDTSLSTATGLSDSKVDSPEVSYRSLKCKIGLFRENESPVLEGGEKLPCVIAALAVPNAYDPAHLLPGGIDARHSYIFESSGRGRSDDAAPPSPATAPARPSLVVTTLEPRGGDGDNKSLPRLVLFDFGATSAGAEEGRAFYARHHGRWLGVPAGRGHGAAAFCLKLVYAAVEVQARGSEGEREEGVERAEYSSGSLATGRYALPSCAVCLDRLDSGVAGVGPGVCGHQTMMADLAAATSCDCWAALGDAAIAACKVCATLARVQLARGGVDGTAVAATATRAAGAAAEAAESTAPTLSASVPRSAAAKTLGLPPGSTSPPSGLSASAGLPPLPPPVACEVCHVHDRLWACLVCGFVGCGRYTSEHSLKHYSTSGHRWALELVTRRIWDYGEDTYAHRLPGSSSAHGGSGGGRRSPPGGGRLSGGGGGGAGFGKGLGGASFGEKPQGGEAGFGAPSLPWSSGTAAAFDGGDLEGNGGKGGGKGGGDGGGVLRWVEAGDFGEEDAAAAKLSGLAAEYEHLLMAQLGEQRRYFEQVLAKEGAAHADRAEAMAAALRRSGAAASEDDEAAAAAAAARAEEVASLRAAASELEAKHAGMLDDLRKAEAHLRGSRKEQVALLTEQRELERRVRETQTQTASEQAECEAQVAELKATITELTFYHRTQEEVDQSPHKDEIRSGTVLVGEANTAPAGPARGKNRSGRRGNRRFY